MWDPFKQGCDDTVSTFEILISASQLLSPRAQLFISGCYDALQVADLLPEDLDSLRRRLLKIMPSITPSSYPLSWVSYPCP